MTTQRIHVGGIGLNYELAGSANAPVVSLNHCFAGNHRYWDFHLPAFAGFRILRHDARGHGESDAPAGPYSLEMMAGDLVGLLDALGIDRVHLCGVSMGGMIAQTVALDHPGRVASMVLVNTTCEYDDDQLRVWRERAALAQDQGIGSVRAALLSRWFSDKALAENGPGYRYMADRLDHFSPDSFAAAAEAICGLNTTTRLSSIQVPVAVIATPDDPGVPTATSRLMAGRLGVDVQWIEPARHLATLEHPERFNALMDEFLEQFRPAG